MSKNTSCIPSFRLNIAVLRAIVLLCLSSSLVFSNISWAQNHTQEEITSLIEKLNTNDESELKDTVREFRKIGKDAVPTLVKAALKNESLLVQISAKHILESSSHEIVADELIKTFGSTDLKFRRRAIKWFNEISWNLELKAAKFVPQLTKLLEDEDSDVRQSAASALGRIGEKAATSETIKALAKLLEDKDNDVRQSAASVLGRIGEKAATSETIKALAKLLEDKDNDVRQSAASALGRIGEKAATYEVIKRLTNLLEIKNVFLRRNAIYALNRMGEKAATDEAIKALNKILNDKDSKDSNVRKDAIYALKSMGKKAATDEVIKALTNLLNDNNSNVRSSAAKALAAMGERAATDEVIKALTKLLSEKDSDVLRNAASALAAMGERAATDEVIKALTNLLNDKNAFVHENALYALAAMGERAATDEVIKILIKFLNDKNVFIRQSATKTLGVMGERAATDEVIKTLTNLLNDNDSNVRRNAFEAIAKMGDKAATSETIKALTKLLNDKDSNVRGNAVQALGGMGDKAATGKVTKTLTKLLNDKDGNVRGNAVQALGGMGDKAVTEEVIERFIQLLSDNNAYVRGNAVQALGGMGEKAVTEEVIERFIQLLSDNNAYVRSRVANALTAFAISIQDKSQANQFSLNELATYISKLKEILKILENPSRDFSKDTIENLRRSLRVLEDNRTLTVFKDKRNAFFWNWLQKNYFIIIPPVYLIFFSTLWFLLIRLTPLSLIQINEILKPYEFRLPEPLGGAPIRTRDLLLFSFFKFRPRVLDAWVKKYIPTARERFELKKTVQERSIHIPVAATLNNQHSMVVNGSHLTPTFKRNRACLLIWGEGGAGKTSLACQIGRWVMSSDSDERPSKHLMLPVLIEEELRLKNREDETPLLEAIQGQLQDLIDSPKPIPQELLEQLLRQRRILVIVDHFSEMSEATRKVVHPDSPNFCINALVVTSRLDEKLGQVTKTTLHPHRIQGDRLSSFMDDYLTHRGKRENFTDIEFFNACIQLSKMVGSRNITVLLAKLFAEQLISNAFSRDLPNNIPDLMLEYLNQINQDIIEDKLDDRSVHKDASILAWQSLQHIFRPVPINIEDALKALGGDDAQNRLNYLENRLHLIQTIGAAKDKIRFVLDPLAEYIAGLHLLETFGNQQHLWEQFLQKAADTEDAPESIQGFLLALQDCYLAKGNLANIPQPVVDELENLPMLSHRQ